MLKLMPLFENQIQSRDQKRFTDRKYVAKVILSTDYLAVRADRKFLYKSQLPCYCRAYLLALATSSYLRTTWTSSLLLRQEKLPFTLSVNCYRLLLLNITFIIMFCESVYIWLYIIFHTRYMFILLFAQVILAYISKIQTCILCRRFIQCNAWAPVRRKQRLLYFLFYSNYIQSSCYAYGAHMLTFFKTPTFSQSAQCYSWYLAASQGSIVGSPVRVDLRSDESRVFVESDSKRRHNH